MDDVVYTGELKVRANDGNRMREIGFILALDGAWHATPTVRAGERRSVCCSSLKAAREVILDEWTKYKGAR